jgi:hypothetical protein
LVDKDVARREGNRIAPGYRALTVDPGRHNVEASGVPRRRMRVPSHARRQVRAGDADPPDEDRREHPGQEALVIESRIIVQPAKPALTVLLAVALAASWRPASARAVLVEAEGFDDPGGWVIDQQFMDQMGSPFLLAHGMGVPVADATTTVELPAPGTYRVWVRTRDWVAPWRVSGAPGKFKLKVDGRELDAVFGTKGAEWRWQDGGTVRIAGTKAALALHDLTGFEGRCDAILLTTDARFVPPDGGEKLAVFRRKTLALPEAPADAGEFDLVVVGGGIAGTCSAISAARLGLDVALVQNRPVLGGNNSSEVRVHLGGKINLPPYPSLGDVVREIGPRKQGNAGPAERYEDGKKLRVARAEKKLQLFLSMHVFKVEKAEGRIVAVVAKHIQKGSELRFPGRVFADCTGDGTVGYLAGAKFRMGRESRGETGESLAPPKADRMTMGTSVQWYSVKAEGAADFPDCPWGVRFSHETCQRVTKGEWNWETGMNRDQIAEFEFIRDYGLRAVYGNWSFLKNHGRDRGRYAGRKLGWVAYVGGKRESRRLVGDVVLRQQDIEERRQFPDACVTTTWSIDLHYPEPKNSSQFPGEEFRSIARHRRIKPYPIPYRCLYSRDVGNLFMAGRCISVTHVALGTIRVMRTCGMMGEVVGMAASLCKKQDDGRGRRDGGVALQEARYRSARRLPGPPRRAQRADAARRRQVACRSEGGRRVAQSRRAQPRPHRKAERLRKHGRGQVPAADAHRRPGRHRQQPFAVAERPEASP